MPAEDHVYPRVTAAVKTREERRQRDSRVLRICMGRVKTNDQKIISPIAVVEINGAVKFTEH
jgi:hypothetical protein